MKKIVKEIIPPQEAKEQFYDEYFCDLCGKQIENPVANCDNKQGVIYYNAYYVYHSFEDGGYKDDYCFDLCNDCIKNKVFPIVEKELNIKPRKNEKEY